ncbi:MAG: hypothetical protein ACTS1X_10165 [Parasphingopyxis sp.]|uniref:hypothetical protein n=1 Tax=Parasphingopyxis sp. TaxID=1920299 RepID=UPI003FA0DF78
MTATPAFANSARAVQDLVGARGSSGESQLQARGFVHVDTHPGGDRNYSYWWNQASDNCIRVTTYDGRYASIDSASDSDCNQGGGGISTGGAVAIGAAALIGGLLLSHRSHHHDDDRHHDDEQREASYERGYRDGLYNQAYHNYGRSDDYADGYEAGVRQREHNTPHRQQHRGRGGYQASVYVADLQGRRDSRADSALRDRGFREVDSVRSGSTAYSYWFNRDTRQCLQMTVADRRVYDIRDVGRNPSCR